MHNVELHDPPRTNHTASQAIPLPPEKVLLTRADLKALGITKSNVSLLRAEAAGRFPRRARLNGTSVVWFRDEIFSFLQELSDARKTQVYADYI